MSLARSFLPLYGFQEVSSGLCNKQFTCCIWLARAKILLDKLSRACNPSTPEMEARELGVQGYPWLRDVFEPRLRWETP